MSINPTDRNLIEAKISPLLGYKAWGVSLGHGSFITLEFGNPVKQVVEYRNPVKRKHGNLVKRSEYTRGEWHLWIYLCAWRLEQNLEVLVACEDSRSKIALELQKIEGMNLKSVKFIPPLWDTLFTFDNQLALRTFSLYSDPSDPEEEGAEDWMLFMPDGNVLAVGPGSQWCCEKSSKSR